MDIYAIVALFLNNSHIIFSLIIFIAICIKFPKELKDNDSDWLRNGLGKFIGTSFGIGGFLTLSIGLCFLAIVERWPSEYISPTAVGTSIFIVVIHLLVTAHYEWKRWTTDIEKMYGIPEPSNKSKNDKDEVK